MRILRRIIQIYSGRPEDRSRRYVLLGMWLMVTVFGFANIIYGVDTANTVSLTLGAFLTASGGLSLFMLGWAVRAHRRSPQPFQNTHREQAEQSQSK